MKWIHCSERLPENGQEVLVWYERSYYGEENRRYQTYGIGFQYKGGWHVLHASSDMRFIAWMPLPDPYEETAKE